METQSILLKRGATFSLAGYVTLPDGDWSATSEIKDVAGNLIAELDVTLNPPVSPEITWPILLYKDASFTETWPISTLYCDIRFAGNNNIIYSPTFTVKVIKEVTDV
jgi:hypothetical protein